MPRTTTPKSSGHADLLATLQARFERNMKRHPKVAWSDVLTRLKASPTKLAALAAMEESGGEPDVIAHNPKTGEIVFTDCSAESPSGRRSCCYDLEGLESRKEHRPEHSAVELAESMGVELLDEAEYRALQELGTFDAKTSSWLKTPADIRKRGGAIFGDWRYGRVFVYHNGAQSYYAARAFRAQLRV
jgi:hypothetical protein